MSNPVIYFLKWVVSETVGGFNGGEAEIQSKTLCNSPKFSACVFLTGFRIKQWELSGIMNDDYTDGIICPYEIPDQWQYEYDRQW